MSMFGQFAASSQFYLYGKKHFTRTGYEAHRKAYDKPDILSPYQELDLSERVYMITGANSGIGREVVQFLASQKATVYMVCRSRERAEAAAAEIVASAGNSRVYVLVGDVGLECDVRRCMQEFADHSGLEVPRLDALVCNAGALLRKKTLTSEGVEATFASHLLFGTYLLGCLAMPSLEATPGSRLIAMSSGGVYNFAFPAWDIATSTQSDPQTVFDGERAFAYANRGKVLLCERWAMEFPGVKIVSSHPGWTDTPAVEAAYGETKKHIEPMRTPWEGAEGIVWLCVAPGSKIDSGSFYLDRKPQVKHMAGPFFTEGSHTKNSPGEVEVMIRHLDDWSNGRRPELRKHFGTMPLLAERPLCALERPIELAPFMGRWYVVADMPPLLGRNTVNHTMDYFYDEAKQNVMIDFSYSDPALKKTLHMLSEATVVNDARTEWCLLHDQRMQEAASVSLVIAHFADDCSSTIVGAPDRSYISIMTRVAEPEEATVESLMKMAQAMGYDVGKISAIVQDWSKGDLIAGVQVEDVAVGA